jgi:hypothetical protein
MNVTCFSELYYFYNAILDGAMYSIERKASASQTTLEKDAHFVSCIKIKHVTNKLGTFQLFENLFSGLDCCLLEVLWLYVKKVPDEAFDFFLCR